MIRPTWDQYFYDIVHAVAKRANCSRRQVGAVLVKNYQVISTGYNGTPMGVQNCGDGGCLRCASDAPSGTGYDTCICVHAEQNAIVLAARHGIATDNTRLYTTLRPCFGCLKESIQAGVQIVKYAEDFRYPDELEIAYQGLVQGSGLRLQRFEV